MKDNVKLKSIKGNIQIFRNGEKILDQDNNINPEYLAVLVNCLPGVPNNNHVDTIRFIGDFGDVDKIINNTEVINNETENSCTFIALAIESDFEGFLTDLKLMMGGVGLTLADKNDLEITKDNETQIEVRWKIKLT